MKIIREIHDLPTDVIDQIMCLADENIASLSTRAITRDSPLLGVERAAVRANLHQALAFLKKPAFDVDEQGRAGVAKCEFMLALDETSQHVKVLGFISYKVRFRGDGSVTVTYAVVDERVRRQGILRAMLDELNTHFVGVTLDCKRAKVPIYERLGFQISGSEGLTIEMRRGLISGSTWNILPEQMRQYPVWKLAQREFVQRTNWQAENQKQERIDKAEKKRVSEFMANQKRKASYV